MRAWRLTGLTRFAKPNHVAACCAGHIAGSSRLAVCALRMWAAPAVCGLFLAKHFVDKKMQLPKLPHSMQEQRRQQEVEAAAAASASAEESRGRERTINRTKSQVIAGTAGGTCCSSQALAPADEY